MKKWADKKRRPLEFKVGDQFLVKILPQQFKAYRSVHKGLVRRYEGSFPVIAKVGKVSYRLDLPSSLKIHPVFHVSMLKPYHEDMEDPSRGESQRAPPIVTKSFDKEVDEVLADRIVRRRGVPPCQQFLIKWKGLPESEATWPVLINTIIEACAQPLTRKVGPRFLNQNRLGCIHPFPGSPVRSWLDPD
ncbi:uncharacterized protein LOC111382220 [Olea europaea var. sylvestris]|uniref:uncharacterized protein LOC111382220 n=1 Tax=Olea europaea var. sylvestris TaxID=158386 RepID=UPI000C1D55F9|nr:uncharacterized protein LOC111382220 [Olea europaea var. sylvestris]